MDGFFQDNDNGMTPKEKKRLYIGLFIFIVLFMSLIIYLDKSQFMKKHKFGQGFDKFSRKQLGIYWFFIGFSLGVSFVFALI